MRQRRTLLAIRACAQAPFSGAPSGSSICTNGTRRYVQHLVAAAAAEVRAWVSAGAAVYVCGSLQGMAAGVSDALSEAPGVEAVARLIEEGRYRRDVY